MTKILVVEDEQIIREGIRTILSTEFNVYTASDLHTAKNLLAQQNFQLVLLDIMLPDGNGLDFYKHYTNFPPVVFLSALDDDMTILNSFNLGSIDYITKPFRLPILLAKIKAIIKQLPQHNDLIHFHHLSIDTKNEMIYQDNTPITLSKQEHQLFFYLFSNRGMTLTREQLLNFLWDSHNEFVEDNTLTVTIRRLRKKIEQNDTIIHTIRGIGYLLQ